MYKIITNSFNFREPSLKIYRKKFLHKEAEETADYLRNIKSESGKTKLLALFLGAGEWYSSNKNGDYFPEKVLRKYYKTFKEHGHVYRHHVNKDPKKKYGDIEFVTYNEKMHRVEGVMVLDNEKNQDILKRIDSGEDIPVSMACKVSHDICSYCGNKSKTLDDYCEHLKFEMNDIKASGLKVYAINPDPVFFDISIVSRPADVTAYVFKKVAHRGVPLSSFFGEKKYKKKCIEKTAKNDILKKLASIEKKVEGLITGKFKNESILSSLAKTKLPDMPENVFKKLKTLSFDDKLSFFNDNNIFLTIKDFLSLLGKTDLLEEVKQILPGIFSRLDTGDVMEMKTPEKQLKIKDIEITKGGIPKEKILTPGTAKNIISVNIRKPPRIQIRMQKGDNSSAISISSVSGGMTIKKIASLKKEAKILSNIYASYKINYANKFNDKLLNSLLVTNNYI
jgi:hypothetical protein